MFSHYQICVFVPHFVGVYGYAGTINRTPTAADGLPKCCKQPAYNATFTHETRGEHSVRHRGPIHRARILTLPNIHIHFNKYAFSHYQMCVFVPHFVGVYGFAGTINRPLRLLVVCQNAANNLSFCGCLRICKHHKIVCQRTLVTRYGTTTYTECLLSHCKNHTFAM